MLSSPAGQDELQSDDLELMLGEMIDCGREYERRSRTGRALSLCQHGQRHAGDPPGHTPALSLRRGGGLSRRIGGRRTVGLPPLRRRRGRGYGLARGRRGPAAPGALAGRSGMCTGRSRAGPAGRATSAAAAAIMRSCGAGGRPAIIFGAGCTIVSKPILRLSPQPAGNAGSIPIETSYG